MADKTAIQQAEAALIPKYYEVLIVDYERAYYLAERMAIWLVQPKLLRGRTEQQMHDEIIDFIRTAHDPHEIDDFEYE